MMMMMIIIIIISHSINPQSTSNNYRHTAPKPSNAAWYEATVQLNWISVISLVMPATGVTPNMQQQTVTALSVPPRHATTRHVQ